MNDQPCEMCGTQTDTLVRIEMEGSTIQVCKKCSNYGTKKPKQPTKQKTATTSSQKQTLDRQDQVLRQDYPKRVRQAREKQRKSQQELSNELNIKKSVLKKIENGDITPDEDLATYLEKKLNIDLYTELETSYEADDGADETLTLGDVADL